MFKLGLILRWASMHQSPTATIAAFSVAHTTSIAQGILVFEGSARVQAGRDADHGNRECRCERGQTVLQMSPAIRLSSAAWSAVNEASAQYEDYKNRLVQAMAERERDDRRARLCRLSQARRFGKSALSATRRPTHGVCAR